MDIGECIRTRLTIREYKRDPVPRDVIARILEAGRLAPSSRNLQPWHFVVVTDGDTLRKIGSIATSGSFVARAPMAVAVAMDNAERPDLDAGRALQQMELQAWSEGLGTCFVGLRDEAVNRQVKEMLGIPDSMVLITILPFGYRLDSVSGRGKKDRRPLAEVAHDGRFGNGFAA